MQTDSKWIFSDKEKALITSLVAKGKKEEKRNNTFAIIDFDNFYSLFTKDEIAVIKKYLAIDPKNIGYKLPFIGTDENTNDLVSIKNQSFMSEGEKIIIPCQYLPRKIYKIYEQLNAAMRHEINTEVLVSYGHRSPARQVFIFFDILERKYNFDFAQTVKRVCFPDYSEHVCMKRQAIDFKTQTGGKSEDFDSTSEYMWLKKKAGRFGFFESYPKDNALDMMYEPWHWHYEAQ